MKVRLYKGEWIEIERNKSIWCETITPRIYDSFDCPLPEIETKQYPIQKWQKYENGETVRINICLADDILQKIFLEQEDNLKREKDAVKWQNKINDKYRNASFIQRLKYLFIRRIN